MSSASSWVRHMCACLLQGKKAKKPLLCCLASDGKLVFKTKADISFCGSYVIIIILEKCKKHFCSHEAENTQPLSRENNWSILLEKQLSFSTTFRVVLYTVWKNETFTLIWKIFRENGMQCKLVLYALVSRNFCKKVVRRNLCNLYIVSLSSITNN